MPTVLITGANRGIGRAMAEAYAKDGWRVISTARRADADLVGEGHVLEVTDAASIAGLKRALADTPIDVLWNNAGILVDRGATLENLPVEDFLQSFAVNSVAPLKLALALADNVAASDGRKMGFVSSRMGSVAQAAAGSYAYRMSKTALNMGVTLLAKDLAPKGIACALFHPGWVRTSMGGSGADISVEESAAGLIRTIAGVVRGDDVPFLTFDGKPLPW